MKRTHPAAIAAIIVMTAAPALTSCIYDSPAGDEFYRTLWESSESPFENLTIEFLCNGNITAQADNAAGSYGTYETQDMTAYFTQLHLIMDSGTVIIEEAHRTKDTMSISWHYQNAPVSYFTKLQRLSAYRQ